MVDVLTTTVCHLHQVGLSVEVKPSSIKACEMYWDHLNINPPLTPLLTEKIVYFLIKNMSTIFSNQKLPSLISIAKKELTKCNMTSVGPKRCQVCFSSRIDLFLWCWVFSPPSLPV